MLEDRKKTIVVTGAAGFLGARTARFLANYYPDKKVLATSRRILKKVELEKAGCAFIEGDLTNQAFCEILTQNAEIIIHCAGLSSIWGEYEDFYHSNVTATKCLLDAAIKNKVEKFILIATPSIYYTLSDRLNIKESDPLPEKMASHYATTKLIAEKMVLEQNGKGISTISLRPRTIIGAEDEVTMSRVLNAYEKGKLKIVGNGENKCDFTSVRNVVEAIICCINAKQEALGKAYNITDGAPVKFWELINYALKSLELKPVTKKIPKKIAMAVAGLSEWKTKLINKKKEPALFRYGVSMLCTNFTIDISKAKENLNYKPIQTSYEAMDEYVEWYKKK